MKYIIILAAFTLLSYLPFAFADTTLDNYNSAIEAALKVVDQGKAINYDTGAVYTRDQLEIWGVEYCFYSTKRRIEVSFLVKSTIKKSDRKTEGMGFTIYMDANGNPDYGVGYGERSYFGD